MAKLFLSVVIVVSSSSKLILIYIPAYSVGGGLKSSAVDVPDTKAQISNVRLEADSTWTETMNYGMIGTSYTAATLDLGGNTLTVPLTRGKTCWLYNTDVLSGLVLMDVGGFTLYIK